MAPSAIDTTAPVVVPVNTKLLKTAQFTSAELETALKEKDPLPAVLSNHKEPLRLSGALDKYEAFDVTPIIGREYVNVDLAELLNAPNSDELLRDLAITISQRGVVFFRKQDNLTNDLQKQLVQRLGELTGKPENSKLHIHPIHNSISGDDVDNQISVISSAQAKKLGLALGLNQNNTQSLRKQWHSDITFEPVPSDYTLLRMTQLPVTGGVKNNFPIYTAERGAPENVGELLEAVHPVIRTNPVTGWKSVFAVGSHVAHINGLTSEESRHFLDWFVQLVVENHDLQVRHKWHNVNDVAIWDNRSVYHAATPDYVFQGLGERSGSRTVGLGERPYLDLQS
ncbi:hypothetical protein TD95_004095, partial [Thielaviopsis punctulata]